VRLGRRYLARGAGGRIFGEGPDLDVAHDLVPELLVETEGALVLLDHLEPDLCDAAGARLVVECAHERLGDALAPSGRNDADAADPRLVRS
jgi:hypothetical protein